jgi:hypothetical protein
VTHTGIQLAKVYFYAAHLAYYFFNLKKILLIF